MIRLDSLFTIEYGSHYINAKEDLDVGTTIVISSQGVDNGCYGFFDTKKEYLEPVISVPRTGSIGEAFVQLHPCNIDDNCLVLKPKHKMSVEYLFYIASSVRTEKWRYMYGRQITPNRLGRLQVISDDEFRSDYSYNELVNKLNLEKNSIEKIDYSAKERRFQITELFRLERGHFHAIDKLKKGKYPTISRVADDNGVIGFYEKPKKASVFPRFLITVSTVTGDAFLQYQPFIATDNVVILIPKKALKLTTLIYIQATLNKTKWRYSYGRQCYKRTLQKTVFLLPINSENAIDEEYIERMVKNQPYWEVYARELLKEK